MTTRELLLEFTLRINKYGVDSAEARELLEANKRNADFLSQAETALAMKKAFALREKGIIGD